MNPGMEFVLAIIVITTIGGILKARYGYVGKRGRRSLMDDRDDHDDRYIPQTTAETVRLKEEVRMLKDRIQTLERIAVDKESSLAREIDDLRNR